MNRQYQSQYQSRKKSLDSNSNINVTNLNNDMRYEKARRTDTIADMLAHRFNNHGYKGFYWKVANKLPEDLIWKYVETAFNQGNNPARYFSYLCKKAGV